MFVMLNDGGVFDLQDDSTPDCAIWSILAQRIRLFNFVTQGTSCSLLRGSTFRDSKVGHHCRSIAVQANCNRSCRSYLNNV